MNAMPDSSFNPTPRLPNVGLNSPLSRAFEPGRMHPTRPAEMPGNGLLRALPAHERERLQGELEAVQLHDAQVLCEAGARQLHVYFPDGATLSLMSFTQAGDSCELMAIDRDGMAGPDVALGGEHSLHRLTVQRGGKAWRLRTSALRQALSDSPALRQQLGAQLQLQLLHLAQGVVCHTHHSITERLCCWLLGNAPGQTPAHIPLTHEAVASLLGVRRESVTQAAGRLQSLGLLSTRRGQLTVHDRDGLRAHACECHERLSLARQRLLGGLPGGDANATEVSSATGWLGQGALDTRNGHHGHNGHNDFNAFSDSQRGGWQTHASSPSKHGSQDRMDDTGPDDTWDGPYRELYEFAPVGFVTVDAQRRVLQSNIAAAVLLGLPASRLQRQVFSELLQPACREDFARFHREVFGGHCRRHCDVALVDHGRGASTVLRLQASTDEDGEECRMVLIDLGEGLAARPGEPHTGSTLTAATITVTGDPQPLSPALHCTLQGTRSDRGSTLTVTPGQGGASWISGLVS